MTTAEPVSTPGEGTSAQPPETLRHRFESTTASPPFSLSEAVSLVIPLVVDLNARHNAGERLFVHPSSILVDAVGTGRLEPDLASEAPALGADAACLAPEQRDGTPGDARSSVYSLGALLYELVTGQHVGPGMQRPSEIIETLPPSFENILGHSLIADPAKRPSDLLAFADALGQMSDDPADGSERKSEFEVDMDVDVSMSMLPPTPVAYHAPPPRGPSKPAEPSDEEKLAELKERLERDTRPRFVVVKDGIDHGPFGSVELLQQIASHTFESTDVLKDSMSRESKPIGEWEEFAPFAEHAGRLLAYKTEKAEIHFEAQQEGKQTRSRTVIALGVLALFVGVAVTWLVATVGTRDDVKTHGAEGGLSIETDAGVKEKKRRKYRGSGAGGRKYAAGLSCDQAMNQYVEEMKIGGPVVADLTVGQLGAVMNGGAPIAGCGVPGSMKVKICAAVQNGRARGVTVITNPPNTAVANCVNRRVRSLSFPNHHKMDRVTTKY